MRKITYLTAAILITAILFGGIALADAAGWWQTTGSKVPARFSQGPAQGSYRPDDIRGSYTFADVAALFGIGQDVLRAAFQLPEDVDLALMRTSYLEQYYAGSPEEVGNSSVQVFVALYLNLPIQLADVWLPEPAVSLIRLKQNDLDADVSRWLSEHTLAWQPDPGGLPQPDTLTEEGHDSAGFRINGKTTFYDLYQAGIGEDEIALLFAGDRPATQISVRDFCQQNGYSFAQVKEALYELLAP